MSLTLNDGQRDCSSSQNNWKTFLKGVLTSPSFGLLFTPFGTDFFFLPAFCSVQLRPKKAAKSSQSTLLANYTQNFQVLSYPAVYRSWPYDFLLRSSDIPSMRNRRLLVGTASTWVHIQSYPSSIPKNISLSRWNFSRPAQKLLWLI